MKDVKEHCMLGSLTAVSNKSEGFLMGTGHSSKRLILLKAADDLRLIVLLQLSSCSSCFELNANLNDKAMLTSMLTWLGMNLWVPAVFEEQEKWLPWRLILYPDW